MKITSPTIDRIWNWLEEVLDPEIPVVSVVDLGIVRDLSWREDQGEPKLVVTITPTYSGCPAMAVIKKDIVTALREHGIPNVAVETRLSPAWTTDWLSEKGKTRLREYGIAPPQRLNRESADMLTVAAGCSAAYAEDEVTGPIDCPRCGSKATRLVSQFGSTPCKAFYVCGACGEPFDYFKCH
jgi:ring-1,2-phenylacetyl-CoA epoxidase subunit PaaD